MSSHIWRLELSAPDGIKLRWGPSPKDQVQCDHGLARICFHNNGHKRVKVALRGGCTHSRVWAQKKGGKECWCKTHTIVKVHWCAAANVRERHATKVETGNPYRKAPTKPTHVPIFGVWNQKNTHFILIRDPSATVNNMAWPLMILK